MPAKAKRAKRPPGGQVPVFQLKITLLGLRPPIWRRIRVAGSHTLDEFHEILQAVMGWTNTHLHQFVIGDRRFGPADDELGLEDMKDEGTLTLEGAVRLAGKSFRYDYDFGDGWKHAIKVEETLPAGKKPPVPVCLAGACNCPPEDCGGPYGYQEFLEALQDPSHPQHQERREWLERLRGPKAKFDPEWFEIESLNKVLGWIAKDQALQRQPKQPGTDLGNKR